MVAALDPMDRSASARQSGRTGTRLWTADIMRRAGRICPRPRLTAGDIANKKAGQQARFFVSSKNRSYFVTFGNAAGMVCFGLSQTQRTEADTIFTLAEVSV